MNAALPSGLTSPDQLRGWRRYAGVVAGCCRAGIPVTAFLKLAHWRPNSFLLESVEGGPVRGRYSIIGMELDLI